MDTIPSIDDLRRAASAFPPRTLGAIIFPGFQALDLWGPIEFFGDCAPAIRPVLIGETLGPVASVQGPQVIADFDMEHAPRLDLLLVPGGQVGAAASDREFLDWLRCRALDAEIVMTVCNGAELLAGTGLLDGRRATTNKALFRSIAAAHPAVRWVPQARWVEDGKFVTSSGVSAGMDMSLAVIARLAGDSVADGLAVFAEYRRHRLSADDPFASLHGLGEPA